MFSIRTGAQKALSFHIDIPAFPSQEGLLVLLPGLMLAVVLLWSECPPLRVVLSLLGSMQMEIVRLLFYGQEGRVWPGTSHRSGKCLEGAWHHLSRYPGEVQVPALRGWSDWSQATPHCQLNAAAINIPSNVKLGDKKHRKGFFFFSPYPPNNFEVIG